MWVQVRLDLTDAERVSVLDFCESVEDAAQRAYKLALETDVKMPADIRNVVVGQKLALKSAHDEIKNYRDLLIAEVES